MKNDSLPRCYSVTDVPSFFVEGLDPTCAVLELHLGEERVRLTRDAFYSMVGSLAKMAVDLLEAAPERRALIVN
jgi:hypothetical protein